jgi:hypothetical protein
MKKRGAMFFEADSVPGTGERNRLRNLITAFFETTSAKYSEKNVQYFVIIINFGSER